MSGADAKLLEETAAEYERRLVPCVFQPFARQVVLQAPAGAGDTVLDVGCGTGVLAREYASAAGTGAHITGLDANPGMLAVAKRLAPEITWKPGDAAALPISDGAFDRVSSQFALMLFEDRTKALREMWRVLAPGGALAVVVFAGLDKNSTYRQIADIYESHAGPETAAALRFPFSLGGSQELPDLCGAAGIGPVVLRTLSVRAVFPAASALALSDNKGWLSPAAETYEFWHFLLCRGVLERAHAYREAMC